MIVSINQPAYLPWLGFFDRIAKSDLHILLDHVQFERGSMTNRNKILSKQGPIWLTVPLMKKNQFGLPISEIKINNTPPKWTVKHKETIRQCYSKAPFFRDYSSKILEIYDNNWTTLNELLRETITLFLDQIGIVTKIICSSELCVSGGKSKLILNLCKEVGAKSYISGPFGRDYLDIDDFERAGIEVIFHDYAHPKYSQNQDDFVPNLSVLDLIFNKGNESLSVITAGQSLIL